MAYDKTELFPFMAIRERPGENVEDWIVKEGFISILNFEKTLNNYPPHEGWEITIYRDANDDD